jgi:hypothetical protein
MQNSINHITIHARIAEQQIARAADTTHNKVASEYVFDRLYYLVTAAVVQAAARCTAQTSAIYDEFQRTATTTLFDTPLSLCDDSYIYTALLCCACPLHYTRSLAHTALRQPQLQLITTASL